MKKWTVALAALLPAAAVLAAGEEIVVVVPDADAEILVAPPAPPMADYEFFLPCIWEGLPQSSDTVPTFGVKLGILGSGGAPVYGVEASVVCSASNEVDGFKGGLGCTVGKSVNGLVLSPVNYVDEVDGVQIGAVNFAKDCWIQFGVLNFMENGFLPVFPLINVQVK